MTEHEAAPTGPEADPARAPAEAPTVRFTPAMMRRVADNLQRLRAAAPEPLKKAAS